MGVVWIFYLKPIPNFPQFMAVQAHKPTNVHSNLRTLGYQQWSKDICYAIGHKIGQFLLDQNVNQIVPCFHCSMIRATKTRHNLVDIMIQEKQTYVVNCMRLQEGLNVSE